MPRGGARAGSGAPLGNTNAVGNAARNVRRRPGAQPGNRNAAGHVGTAAGAPLGNTNAAGHVGTSAGAPSGNTNAAGHVGTGAGAPVGNSHRGAAETSTRIAYDEKIDDLQRAANCAEVPFNVVIEEKDQSKALKAVRIALELAKRVVVCAVCNNITEESFAQLCPATMNEPPPISWLAHLQTTVNSIVIEGAPDPESLRRQYRVPVLKEMCAEWSTLLLSPLGIYPVFSAADTKVPDTCVFPLGRCDELHVDERVTHATLAKACVCDICAGRLRVTPRAPQGKLPKFACANDLCSGTRTT
jgi:hypothetical protein